MNTQFRPGRFKIPRLEPMRIPDFVLKANGFLVSVACEDEDNLSYDLWATGFFVTVSSEPFPNHPYFYFVTASHAVKQLKGPCAIKVNGKDHKNVIVEVDRWFNHPSDPNADVSISIFDVKANIDILGVQAHLLRTRERLVALDIGVGDEVFFPGLFTFTQEESERNHPIVRHGNLAMIPPGKIPSSLGYIDAYLIEGRSIGGLSGSPVYVRRTTSIMWNYDPGNSQVMHGLTGEIHLLGMIHGHWDVNESQINSPDLLHDRKHGVNMGIAQVIPSEKIIETLNHPDLVADRARRDQERLLSISPGLD